MTDLAVFHVKTVRAGEHDSMNHDAHSRVHHDGSVFYFDLTGRGVDLAEWRAFVEVAWGDDEEPHIDISVWDSARGIFRADVD